MTTAAPSKSQFDVNRYLLTLREGAALGDVQLLRAIGEVEADPKAKAVVFAKSYPCAGFALWTVRVRPPRGGGPDDGTYAAFPALVYVVPRGCVVLENWATGTYEVVLPGMRKFGCASSLDDDDFVPTEAEPAEDDGTGGGSGPASMETVLSRAARATPEVTHWWASKKENGHTVIFRVVDMDVTGESVSFLIGGTRNCVSAIRLAAPYELDPAALFPSDMVKDALGAMLKLIASNPEEALAVLRRPAGLYGEHQTNTHIIFHDAPGLMFFDTTLPRSVFPVVSLTGPYSTEQVSDPAFLLQLRSGGNWPAGEGYVLCGYAGEEPSGTPLCRIKVKTLYYTLMRMTRQMYNLEEPTAVMAARVVARMYQRNAQFLGIDVDFLRTAVQPFLEALVAYMQSKGLDRKDIAFDSAVGMAPVLKSFVSATGACDNFQPPGFSTPAACTAQYKAAAAALQRVLREYGSKAGASCGASALASASASSASAPFRGVVAFANTPQGMGKTTVFKRVGAVADQPDMSGDQFKGSMPKLTAALKAAFARKSTNNVFIHRCNVTVPQRANLQKAAQEAGVPNILYIVPAEEGDLRLLYTCLRGVLTNRDDHETLGSSVSIPTRVGAVLNFWRQCTPVNVAEERAAGVLPVRWLSDSAPTLSAEVVGILEALADGRERCLDGPWVATVLTGPELRRPVSDVAADIISSVRGFRSSGSGGGSGGGGKGTAAAVGRTPLYYALNISSADKMALLTAAKAVFPFVPATYAELSAHAGKRPVVTADHVTIKFKPGSSDVKLYKERLGRSYPIEVKSLVRSSDSTVAAASVVVPDFPEVTTPHITLAYIPPRRAVESRTVIESSASIAVPFSMTIHGVLAEHF